MSANAASQLTLFGEAPDAGESPNPEETLARLRTIGVTYEPDFLSAEDADQLLADIDAQTDEWRDDLQRRVQHYGWRYDYKERAVTPDMQIGPLPDFILPVANMLQERGWFDATPDQVIVNEYEPGQGSPRTPTATASGRRWQRSHSATAGRCSSPRRRKTEQTTAGSLPRCRGDDGVHGRRRDRWEHGIRPRKTDPDGHGNRRARKRRVSGDVPDGHLPALSLALPVGRRGRATVYWQGGRRVRLEA